MDQAGEMLELRRRRLREPALGKRARGRGRRC
jgi:hypothetical protein